ncbi:hypothetical protein GF380_03905 [Candidatus Uhrbacteria bacterium]|nr:hypothetical protein [Candidatus Uhrbacteria bacterium]MBD3284238.1 hypothetical protein [Candidatus Uhrbacteria bacterium]
MTGSPRYLRALAISALKSTTYMFALLFGIIFIAEHISPFLFLLTLYCFYFLITFLFAEWIFNDVHIRTKALVIIILISFIIETILLVAFFRRLGMTTFNMTVIYRSFIFLAMHAGAMIAAKYVRKRFWATSGLAEGLES